MDINWRAMFDMAIFPILGLIALFGGGFIAMKIGEKIAKFVR